MAEQKERERREEEKRERGRKWEEKQGSRGEKNERKEKVQTVELYMFLSTTTEISVGTCYSDEYFNDDKTVKSLKTTQPNWSELLNWAQSTRPAGSC